MNTDDVRTALEALLVEIAPDCDPAELDPQADLRTEADLDSMDFLNLVEGVAQTLGVDIPEADYAQVRSLDGLTGYVTARATAGAAAAGSEGT